MTLTPKNWESFQHYKDRSPAWIKLHRGLLDNFDFHCLPVASRALAPMLWLLASEYTKGEITSSIEEIAFRFRMPIGDLKEAIKPLVEKGFFVASDPLAECKQDAFLEKEEEREEEKEKEKRQSASASPSNGKHYAFESGVIKLNQRDFDLWKVSYSQLDVGAELLAMTEWAGEQRSWFNAVKGALAKKNQSAKERNNSHRVAPTRVDPRL